MITSVPGRQIEKFIYEKLSICRTKACFLCITAFIRLLVCLYILLFLVCNILNPHVERQIDNFFFLYIYNVCIIKLFVHMQLKSYQSVVLYYRVVFV